jgi:antitoxin YefM
MRGFPSAFEMGQPLTEIQVYPGAMETTSLSDLKSHLSEYADRAEREHEQFMITRNGRPAVVMISADEWESLQETLFWLSQPGIHEDLAEAEADVAAGRTFDETQVRRSLGLPPRP